MEDTYSKTFDLQLAHKDNSGNTTIIETEVHYFEEGGMPPEIEILVSNQHILVEKDFDDNITDELVDKLHNTIFKQGISNFECGDTLTENDLLD